MTARVALLWPPRQDYRDLPLVASWYFGHLFDRIWLPIEVMDLHLTTPDVLTMPAVAPHALCDIHKVSFLPSKSTELERLLVSPSTLISTENNIQANEVAVKSRKLPGSQTIKLPQGDASSPAYYFIGESERDKDDAYFRLVYSYWNGESQHEDLLAATKTALSELRSDDRLKQGVNVFGTGPSLMEIADRDLSAHFNIVCNSIIRNRTWMQKQKPRIIVASDAHFHFSTHAYSGAFLADLVWALKNDPRCFFLTFDKFAVFLRSRFPEFKRQIIGLAANRGDIGFNLLDNPAVKPGESVVNMFLLPLACFLSDKVTLFGFTGRGKTDQYFWSHCSAFQYDEHMAQVRTAHPAFFRDRDFQDYNDLVDRQLGERIQAAEGAGKRIVCGSTSLYKSLGARPNH